MRGASGVAHDAAAVQSAVSGQAFAHGVTDVVANACALVRALVGALTESIAELTRPALVARASSSGVAAAVIVAGQSALHAVKVLPRVIALADRLTIGVRDAGAVSLASAVLGVAVLAAIAQLSVPSLSALAAVRAAHTVARAVVHAQGAVRSAERSIALADRGVLRSGHAGAAAEAVERHALAHALAVRASPACIALTLALRVAGTVETAGLVASRVAAVSSVERRVAAADVATGLVDDASTLALAHDAQVVDRQADRLGAVVASEARIALAALHGGLGGIARDAHALASGAAAVRALDDLAACTGPFRIALALAVTDAGTVAGATLGASLDAAICAHELVFADALSVRQTGSLSSTGAIVEALTVGAVGTGESGQTLACTLDARSSARARHGHRERRGERRHAQRTLSVQTVRRREGRDALALTLHALALFLVLATVGRAQSLLAELASGTAATILVADRAHAQTVRIAHTDVRAVVRARARGAVHSSPRRVTLAFARDAHTVAGAGLTLH